MKKFSIVKAKTKLGIKKLMRITDLNNVTYHLYKEKKYSWGNKYGAYGVLEQTAGNAIFYNVGQNIEAEEIEHLLEIDVKKIAVGYKF